MSTKYILETGRHPVGIILRQALIPMVSTMMLLNDPELAKDPTDLKSRVKIAVEPLVASLIEELSGNAEGADKVLVETTLSQMKRHANEMLGRRTSDMNSALDALFSKIFAEPEQSSSKKLADTDLDSSLDRLKARAKHDQNREEFSLADLLGIDPTVFTGKTGRSN